jgi:FlaA1/EpsC-like NDP-sugar epimerase
LYGILLNAYDALICLRPDWRKSFIVVHDAVMAFFAMAVAFWLRYEIAGASAYNIELTLLYSALFGLTALIVVILLRLYRDLWRFTSLPSLIRSLQAAVLTTLLFSLLAFLFARTENVPRSVPLIACAVFVVLLMISRLLRRFQMDGNVLQGSATGRIPVILIGAGSQADGFIRMTRRNRDAPYRVEALLSEDPELKGRRMQDVAVLGTPQELKSVVQRFKAGHKAPRQIQRVIFTGDEPYAGFAAKVLEDCDKLGISIARLPHHAELRDGLGSEADVRPVAIEDVLGRPQVRIDEALMGTLIRGRRVMVTGAGGSIGSELCRQICAHSPARIVMLDHSEFNLYSVDGMMADKAPTVARRAGICDVRDRRRVASWFAQEAPEVVFHAAALKHVPLVEDHVSDAVLTNVVGTRNVADAARQAGCAAMVLLSTDKAVNPANVMGATKRAAEAYCQALDIASTNQSNETRYVTVRFGNVLGSTGSVVPRFQQQLAHGGPLTVTHPEITRYFMSIPEAVQLVLQASASAVAGQSGVGQIFVLDMGEPIKIVDLARQMIRLSGKRPDVDVKIEHIGLRPGEKLFEELAYGREELASSEVSGVLLARPAVYELAILEARINGLEMAARSYNDERCVELLHELVPEFTRNSRNDYRNDRLIAAQ